jgi:hypothetical protein
MAVTSSRPVRFAEQNAERGAGEHPRVDERRREAEAGDENAGEHREVDDVVEHQPEEGVDVAGRRPRVFRRGDPYDARGCGHGAAR